VGKTARPPTWIKPQLTRLVDEAPTGSDWLHEIMDSDTIRTKIEQAGYTEVTDLSRDSMGVWRARAERAAKQSTSLSTRAVGSNPSRASSI
jgi:hypothetical protein